MTASDTSTMLYLSLHTRQRIDKVSFLFISCVSGIVSFQNVNVLWKSDRQLLSWFVFLTGTVFIGVSWALYWKARQYDKEKLIGFFFLTALLIRVSISLLSPFTNQFVDLCMDQDMGQLIINNIDPYNFSDNVIVRNQLRIDARAYTYFTGLSQSNWDYHAGSQLPLLELMMGWIESLGSHPLAYRIVFSWFDSLLCVYILLFINQKWKAPVSFVLLGKYISNKITTKDRLIAYIICLSIIAPILLRSGTLVASFKGSMTLFTLSAIFFSYQKSRREYLFLSAFLFGFATAFMAISVLALPLILWNLYAAEKSNSKFVYNFLIYTIVSLLVCLIWFMPFYNTILPMVQHRLDAGISMPIHGSIWRIAALILPMHWHLLKTLITVGFVLINLVGFWKKKLSWEIITASLFIFFLHLLTIDGSMDRINISLMMCIILYGVSQRLVYTTLVPIYFLGGIILVSLSLLLGIAEKFFEKNFIEYSLLDGIFNTIFFLLYSVLITKLALKQT